MSDAKKAVMFTMDRQFTIAGFGHNIEFLPGEPRSVPPLLHAEAMRCGARPMEGQDVSHVAAPSAKAISAQGDARTEQVIAAMDVIVEQNNRMDFGANRVPTAKAIFRNTGIELENKEREAMWGLRNARRNAATNPNNTNISPAVTEAIAEKAAQAVEVAEAAEAVSTEAVVAEATETAAPKATRKAKAKA